MVVLFDDIVCLKRDGEFDSVDIYEEMEERNVDRAVELYKAQSRP